MNQFQGVPGPSQDDFSTLNSKAESLNSNMHFIHTSSAITSLSDIPVNSHGRILLSSDIAPTPSGQKVYNYWCVGDSTRRTIFAYEQSTGYTWSVNGIGNVWYSWVSADSKIDALNSKIANIDVGTYAVPAVGCVDGGYVRYVVPFSRKDNPTRTVTIIKYQIAGGSQVTEVSDVNVEFYSSYLMIYSNNATLVSNSNKRPVVFEIQVV